MNPLYFPRRRYLKDGDAFPVLNFILHYDPANLCKKKAKIFLCSMETRHKKSPHLPHRRNEMRAKFILKIACASL
jgi:hypothetical protein